MRIVFAALLLLVALVPAAAQTSDQARPAPQRQQGPASDEKAAETKKLVEAGRKRQDAENARTMKLWTRWTYAVCVGCSLGEPRHIRVVHTTPARVLAGIPAAQDDAREMALAAHGRPQRRLHLRQVASRSGERAVAHEVHHGASQPRRAA
jgi:hypothetical protein